MRNGDGTRVGRGKGVDRGGRKEWIGEEGVDSRGRKEWIGGWIGRKWIGEGRKSR